MKVLFHGIAMLIAVFSFLQEAKYFKETNTQAEVIMALPCVFFVFKKKGGT